MSNWVKSSGVGDPSTAGFIVGFTATSFNVACEGSTGAVSVEGTSNGTVNEAVDELAFANSASV